ncbi:MAG: hypothetical protein KatS3mg002_0023 [Candidatus Woesearchaeota archaeon]|nr:MAG: hypothetical protein KatS3mg002_0023 [Candidatus Woesearchaeota archaeon]
MSTIKNFIAGTLFTISIYGQQTNKDSSYVEKQSRINIPLSYSKTLSVNKDNNERRISLLNELEGISYIRKILSKSEYEEAWIYDPKNSRWIEIGLDETGWIKDSTGYSTKVSLDSLYIDKLMDSLDVLISYHFHPAVIKPFMTDTSSMLPEMKNAVKKFGVEAFLYSSTAIPSIQDINTMIGEQSKFYRKKPYGKITHCVASYFGITEYYLTEKAKEFILEDKNNTIIFNNTDNFLTSLSLYMQTIYSLNKKSEINLEEECINNINYALALFNNDFIDIKFYPYRSLFVKESEEQ